MISSCYPRVTSVSLLILWTLYLWQALIHFVHVSHVRFFYDNMGIKTAHSTASMKASAFYAVVQNIQGGSHECG